nr:hypothetical protein [Mycoplasmopsis bovis]
MQKQAKKEWAKEKQPKFNDGTLLVEELNVELITTHMKTIYTVFFYLFFVRKHKG